MDRLNPGDFADCEKYVILRAVKDYVEWASRELNMYVIKGEKE